MQKVLITGATGVLGKAIVRSAISAGLDVLQGARNPSNADPAAEAIHLDYAAPSTILPALEGVSALVLMAPPLEANAPALLGPVITAAKNAQVAHIVLISAFGVDQSEQAPMRIVEHLVIDSGVPYTILRPNFFMENFSAGFLATGVREQHAIYLAAGEGKTSFISIKDIAAAVIVAVKQSLIGKEFDLTGPAALNHVTVARIISEVSGHTIVYHSLSEDQMLDGARAQGMPEPIVAYLGTLYSLVRAGFAADTSNDFGTITGRKPVAFDTFARSAFGA